MQTASGKVSGSLPALKNPGHSSCCKGADRTSGVGVSTSCGMRPALKLLVVSKYTTRSERCAVVTAARWHNCQEPGRQAGRQGRAAANT